MKPMQSSSMTISRARPKEANALPGTGLPRRVWVLAAVWFLVVGAFTVIRVYTLQSRGFDLGFFTQAIGGVWLEGFAWDTPMTGWGFFDDHFSPLVLPITPLVALADGALVLVVIQSLALAAAIPLVWRLARLRGASETWAWRITMMFAVSPPLLFAAWFDFHASVLAVPFFVLLYIGLETGWAWQIWVGVAGASLAREDMALLVGALLLVHFVRLAPRERLVLLIPAACVALGRLVVNRDWYLESGFAYASNSDAANVISTAMGHAWRGGVLLMLLVAISIPWLLALIKPNRDFLALMLLAAPLLFSSNIGVKLPDYHYFAVVPVFFAGAAASQADRRTEFGFVVMTVLTVLAGPLGLHPFGVFSPSVPEVVARGIGRIPQIHTTHGLLDCLNESELAWTGPDNLLAPAGATAQATRLPLPFLDYTAWGLTPPLLAAEDIDWEPDVVLVPGKSWHGPPFYEPSPADLSRYGYWSSIGDDFLHVWVVPERSSSLNACLPATPPSD